MTPEPKFTDDWVTNQVPHWSKALAKFKGKPGVLGLEIGTWEGRSAHWFLSEIVTHHPTSQLTSVDLTHNRLGENKDILEEIHGERAHFVAEEAIPFLTQAYLDGEHFDFIYLDCAKDSADFFPIVGMAWEVLKVGGVMIFDDFCWPGKTATNPADGPLHYSNPPRAAISAFLQCYYARYKHLHQSWQVIVEKTA